MNWQSPTPDRFDALLLGSANAVRHAGSEIARWQGRTAHVVGPATAEAARRAGLEIGIVGRGGLQSVVDEIAAAGPAHFLRLALVALAPRIAEAAGEGWARVEIAAQPADRVLLALARDICH